MLRSCCFSNTRRFSKLLTSPVIANQKTSNVKFITGCNFNITRCLHKKEESELQCIYYGPLTNQIRAVKLFSLASSMAGLVVQPYIIKEAASFGTPILIALCSVVGFFTFVTPVLLHFITKKYVIEISYNPKSAQYVATTINFFLVKKQHEFTTDDVEVPDIPGMFTTMKIKGKPLFIEARHFSDPIHYVKMMGYDKPMDFKLGNIEKDDQIVDVKLEKPDNK